jgi:predicted unusual protein kinase regulating ubiquinone biosynthesis (AarF/ABC1/UbiB family)
MSLTSGMCSSLDPAFNIWNSVEPYSAQLIRDEGGNLVQDLAKQAISALGLVARLPQRVDSLITRIDEGSITVQTPRLDQRLATIERGIRQAIAAVIFAALLIGGILLRPHFVVFGIVLMSASAVPLLYAVLAGLFARRGPQRQQK